jgi:hypothetical protein
VTDPLDALRALDPCPPASRPRVTGSDWGSAMAAAITAAPPRRARARRWAGALVAAGAAAALVVLMAVLIVATGGEDPAPAAGEVVLVAAPIPGEPPPDAALLEQAADVVRARARILGADGVTVSPDARGLVLGLPANAPEGLAAALTATGELRAYAVWEVLAGPPPPSLDAAVRRAQRAAGVRVRGGGEADVPPGYVVARDDRFAPGGQALGSSLTVFRGRFVLGNGAVRTATVVDDAAGSQVSLAFTTPGAEAFAGATRGLAQTGALANELQTLVLLLDGRVVTRVTIDYERHPMGLDGRDGLLLELPPDLDPAPVAAQIATGPLPVRLAAARAHAGRPRDHGP